MQQARDVVTAHLRQRLAAVLPLCIHIANAKREPHRSQGTPPFVGPLIELLDRATAEVEWVSTGSRFVADEVMSDRLKMYRLLMGNLAFSLAAALAAYDQSDAANDYPTWLDRAGRAADGLELLSEALTA